MAEEKNRLLSEFFLLRDDVMNFVALRGLVAVKNQKENDMWRQASLLDCSWNVPLKEVLSMDEISASTGKNVLVIENSGVYSILLELLPGVPMVCSSGQFTYAVWVLLRKLVASDSQLYYCGDLDPEGLLMAQRLLTMFPKNAQTVTMDLASYLKVGTPSQLGEQRLKQLSKLSNPELKKVADNMIKSHLIAFQEGLIDDVVQEVKRQFYS